MKKILFVVFAGLAMCALFGCESETKNAKIEVWLTDAPGDFEEVNIDIQGVEIHTGDGASEQGWQPLAANKGIYNLLELTNGMEMLLGTLELPAGRVSQVRLKLGDNNTLKTGGVTHALATPSGQQSGLKLQLNTVLKEGITYKVLLDFHAAKSIVQRGNGTYSLKPVIRTITEAQDGAISGTVQPIASTPAVFAVSGEDTLSTTYANDAGQFLLRGLPAGSYKVVFLPNSEYDTTAVENVAVTVGNVTPVGLVTIPDAE